MGRLAFALVLALAGLAPAARPEAALDRLDKYPEHGFALERSSSFEPRPVPPGQPGLLLVFAPKDAPVDRSATVLHEVYGLRYEGDASLALKRWVLDTFRPAKLDAVRSVRVRYGRSPVRFHGEVVEEEGVVRSLFVHGWAADGKATVFVGHCDQGRWRRDKRAFERVASSFKFFSEAELDEARAKWERHYRRSSLPHREARIDVAAALVEGWRIKDTQHSVILYHGASTSPVLEQIARNLVGVRKRFERDFPPDRPIDALSIVRVCRDRGEYLTYGGNPSTVGYFNPATQELVLYDAREDRSRAMPDDHPTMRTLYHEACHQFLHHTASALSPHSWFDEGTAEFYAGAVLVRGVVKGVDALESRERFLRSPDTQRRLPELGALLAMTQDEFYAEADVNYSTGYAFVRFLRTSREARANRRWGELPDIYFERLRAAWRREAEQLALSGINAARYSAAVERARAAALEAMLEDVDLAELESAFRAWLLAPVAD